MLPPISQQQSPKSSPPNSALPQLSLGSPAEVRPSTGAVSGGGGPFDGADDAERVARSRRGSRAHQLRQRWNSVGSADPHSVRAGGYHYAGPGGRQSAAASAAAGRRHRPPVRVSSHGPIPVLPPSATGGQLKGLLFCLRERVDNMTATSTAAPQEQFWRVVDTFLPDGARRPQRDPSEVDGDDDDDDHMEKALTTNDAATAIISSCLGAAAPTAARVGSSFAAAGAHSSFGAMLQLFAEKVVELFTRGLDATCAFPRQWEARLAREKEELRPFLYELQGFGVLYAYLWTHLALMDSFGTAILASKLQPPEAEEEEEAEEEALTRLGQPGPTSLESGSPNQHHQHHRASRGQSGEALGGGGGGGGGDGGDENKNNEDHNNNERSGDDGNGVSSVDGDNPDRFSPRHSRSSMEDSSSDDLHSSALVSHANRSSSFDHPPRGTPKLDGDGKDGGGGEGRSGRRSSHQRLWAAIPRRLRKNGRGAGHGPHDDVVDTGIAADGAPSPQSPRSGSLQQQQAPPRPPSRGSMILSPPQQPASSPTAQPEAGVGGVQVDSQTEPRRESGDAADEGTAPPLGQGAPPASSSSPRTRTTSDATANAVGSPAEAALLPDGAAPLPLPATEAPGSAQGSTRSDDNVVSLGNIAGAADGQCGDEADVDAPAAATAAWERERKRKEEEEAAAATAAAVVSGDRKPSVEGEVLYVRGRGQLPPGASPAVAAVAATGGGAEGSAAGGGVGSLVRGPGLAVHSHALSVVAKAKGAAVGLPLLPENGLIPTAQEHSGRGVVVGAAAAAAGPAAASSSPPGGGSTGGAPVLPPVSMQYSSSIQSKAGGGGGPRSAPVISPSSSQRLATLTAMRTTVPSSAPSQLQHYRTIDDVARAERARQLRRELGVRSVTNYGHERDVQDYMRTLTDAQAVVDREEEEEEQERQKAAAAAAAAVEMAESSPLDDGSQPTHPSSAGAGDGGPLEYSPSGEEEEEDEDDDDNDDSDDEEDAMDAGCESSSCYEPSSSSGGDGVGDDTSAYGEGSYDGEDEEADDEGEGLEGEGGSAGT